MKRVAIVGGGIAGLSAAIRVAEAGWIPILIEASKRLGGRASSFEDPRSSRVLDNCQHVVMGCCSNLVDFYDRLGVLDAIEWHRENVLGSATGTAGSAWPFISSCATAFSRCFLEGAFSFTRIKNCNQSRDVRNSALGQDGTARMAQSNLRCLS